MNLRSIDLNLLVVLDALLDEAHVSRAAERLGLSQPAASSALERCRHLFRDPLLERGGGTMRRTPKAEELRASLKNLLADVVAVLDPPPVPLSEIKETIRITMADFPAVIVVAPLLEALSKSAPGIDLVIQPWHGAAAALEGLAKGTVDIAVSVFPSVEQSIRREELLFERYMIVMRKDHPAAGNFNFDRWLEFPHILVSGRGDTQGPLDDALAQIGRTRRIGIVVPSFLMVVPLLLRSDFISMIPSRVLSGEVHQHLTVFEPNIDIPGFPLHIASHIRREQDAGVKHLVSIIRSLLSSLPSVEPTAQLARRRGR